MTTYYFFLAAGFLLMTVAALMAFEAVRSLLRRHRRPKVAVNIHPYIIAVRSSGRASMHRAQDDAHLADCVRYLAAKAETHVNDNTN